MKPDKFYLRFLNVLHALESDDNVGLKDPENRRLLEVIAIRQQEGHLLTVSTAMLLSDIASPATLHRKIDALVQAGWVEHQFEGENRRTKYLACTPKAMQYFDRMGRAIQRNLKTI